VLVEAPVLSPRTALSRLAISSGSRYCSSNTCVTIFSCGATSNWLMISSARSRFSTVSIINSVFVFCSGRMRPDVPSIGIRI
jgi:hypothetical protein